LTKSTPIHFKGFNTEIDSAFLNRNVALSSITTQTAQQPAQWGPHEVPQNVALAVDDLLLEVER
jgi:hypothetical protein